MVLTDQLSSESPTAVAAHQHAGAIGERAARRTLLAQIGRLERELGEMILAAFPHVAVPHADPPVRGPRLLDLGELERVRDDLAQRVHSARVAVARRAEHEARSRARLQEMLRDPARHKWERVPAADVGESSCGAYQVLPRLGVIGMLMGWWHVKVSSGCPPAAPA
ncbi:MAG: hypothetical protein JWQ20_2692 [Conexibacter sp.]|nr:hypothetical protein [Conexibacter sp.]